MRKMSTIGRNARVQTFAKVVDSFVDRCLWKVMPDLLLLSPPQKKAHPCPPGGRDVLIVHQSETSLLKLIADCVDVC